MTTARRRAVAVGAAFVVGAAAFQVARGAVVPSGVHLWWNLGFGLAVTVIGLVAGLRTADLGLERRTLRSGLVWGGVCWGIAVAVFGLVALAPWTRGVYDDHRAVVPTGTMLWKVLVVIPLGTALMEELVFRGVILGAASRVTTTVRAVLVSAVAFGLWHVQPTLGSLSRNATTDGAHGAAVGAIVVGIVAAMTGAGLVLAWLRLRSGSLLAPFLAHWGVNATAFLVAWLVARG